ncbi:MAG: Gfo/Idh/MocA family oxidoreductase [Verrucomicrobiae bacterium]|nr:Gfo/Idh/MocA family oxidoreductase [Verrucomicrobiae bacterium]
MPSPKLRMAVFGAGFWTRYQLAAWQEVGGVEFVGIYNRTAAKAEAVARQFGIPAVYDDPAKLLRETRPDFVDNITEVGGHKPLSLLCARQRIPCICQKPMAGSLPDARAMVASFARKKTPFFVHENWRWQAPLIALRKALAAGTIGAPFRARLTMVSGFDCWANQPALRKSKRFILTDLGVHLLDVARVLFGEAVSLYCQTHKTLAPRVQGENVATLLLAMGEARTSVIVELGYAKTPLEPGEREAFPQTRAFVEGPRGSIELTNDYILRITTASGTLSTRHAPPRYDWADPQYDIAHASIVPCNAHLLAALQGRGPAETTGADNLRTLELAFGAYASAAKDRVLHFRR